MRVSWTGYASKWVEFASANGEVIGSQDLHSLFFKGINMNTNPTVNHFGDLA